MKSRILPIIAGSFGLICVLQLTNLSLANAREDTNAGLSALGDDGNKDVKKNPSSGGLSDDDDGNICVTTTLAEALLAEQERLDLRGLEITKREKALAALEVKLDEQLNAIQTTKNTVEAQLEKMESVATSDLEHLVSMYETMKPKKAAEIFDSMAPSFAAGFLRDMNSTRAGLIMSEMSAKKSYEVSLVIANRNAKLRNSPQRNN